MDSDIFAYSTGNTISALKTVMKKSRVTKNKDIFIYRLSEKLYALCKDVLVM